jgi:hypothetical protein
MTVLAAIDADTRVVKRSAKQHETLFIAAAILLQRASVQEEQSEM